MRLNRRASRRFELESIRLPLIGMINVVMFLLLYFIIAGSIAAEEAALSTTLGAAQGRSSSLLQSQVLIIEMREGEPVFRIGDLVMSERAALADVLGRLPRDAGIIVRPAPDVPVEATAAAVQVAKDAGFVRISYLVSGV